MKVRDWLAESDRTALTRQKNQGAVMVTYRFDAMPRALRVAIPNTYAGELFEAGSKKEKPAATERRQPASRGGKRLGTKQVEALLAHGRKVTVVGVGPNPARTGTSIVAGAAAVKKTGESKPVAVRIDADTSLVGSTGEPLPATAAAALAAGGVIVVEGKLSKRGVIRAKRAVVVA